jgi:hypothetical protein
MEGTTVLYVKLGPLVLHIYIYIYRLQSNFKRIHLKNIQICHTKSLILQLLCLLQARSQQRAMTEKCKYNINDDQDNKYQGTPAAQKELHNKPSTVLTTCARVCVCVRERERCKRFYLIEWK